MKPAIKPTYQTIYRVIATLGGKPGKIGDFLSPTRAYDEVSTLERAGLKAIVEMAQVRVIAPPIA
jgi:hypothetical protein